MKQMIEWLMGLLGFGNPPHRAEDPSAVHREPIFEDMEAWYRETEEMARWFK